MMGHRWLLLLALLAGLMPAAVWADEDEEDASPSISLETVRDLQSVLQIDFGISGAAWDDFDTGVVTVSDDGRYFAVPNANGEVVVWDDRGEIRRVSDGEGDVMAVTFTPDSSGVVVVRNDILVDPPLNRINFTPLDGSDDTVSLSFPGEGMPQEVWMSDDDGVWVELFYADSRAEIVYRAFDPDEPLVSVPYGPADDPDALVRIGRIPPPAAITSSPEGIVKRWDLEANQVTAEAAVEDGPAVFGQISADGRFLAWRDPMSTALHRLDFETGEDEIVAQLGGAYVQGYFMAPGGDVIIGVDVDFEPIVLAWEADTGARIDLGTYRECSRVPDLIRLSADGTTLVIGCDTGLDVWRIMPGDE